jgi:predicted nucleotidyltransferase
MIQEIQNELQSYGCHTIIFYGSRARGDATPESDWDFVGIRESGTPALCLAKKVGDQFIDAWIHPEDDLEIVDEFLKLVDGKILKQKGQFGTDLILRIQERLVNPDKLTDDKRNQIHIWYQKTLERIKRGDAEALYRRTWLLNSLLPDYFMLRDQWYQGPKLALQWLSTHDSKAFDLATRAMMPDASSKDLENWVKKVLC